MSFEEVLSLIRQRYRGVEILPIGDVDVLVVPGELPIPLPPHLPTDPVDRHFLEYLCDRLSMLHRQDVGLDWS